MNLYPQIFFESARQAFFLPLGSDTAFFAMKAFGGYDMTAPVLLAIVGATFGQSLNYVFGRLLLFYSHKSNLAHNIPKYLQVAHLFNRYGIFLLVFSWAPLCGLLTVLAGFLNARVKYVLLLVALGQAAHYGWYLQ